VWGNVILYDNAVSSGGNIDTVVMAMRKQLNGFPMEFIAITPYVFRSSKVGYPRVQRLRAVVPRGTG
jgi:hypothetical protein